MSVMNSVCFNVCKGVSGAQPASVSSELQGMFRGFQGVPGTTLISDAYSYMLHMF